MPPGSLVLVARSEEERREVEEAVRVNEYIPEHISILRSVLAVELEI